MKIFECNKLTHTLQTNLGMVTDQGKPQQREFINLPKALRDSERIAVPANVPNRLPKEAAVDLFIQCVLEYRLPQSLNVHKPSDDVKRLKRNIHACCDSKVNVDFMKRNIVALHRLDLEQAAAIVISSIRSDVSIANRMGIVDALIKELDPSLLVQSCMWLDRDQQKGEKTVEEGKLSRLINLLWRMCTNTKYLTENVKLAQRRNIEDSPTLLPLFLRVRRCNPRTRCLFIPQWVFDTAGVKPPSEFAIWDEQGRITPGHGPIAPSEHEDDIVLSRKAFRGLQRRLLHYHRFWDPAIRLRKAIVDFEKSVIYSSEHIKSMVLPSQDTLIVAHYFFALQRRLQRKVVSDLNWTGFLAKGESGNVLQNNPDIPTSFEQRLNEFSGQKGVPLAGHILPQIDQCCLLMEDYVSVYGKGDKNNLVFTLEKRGGSGQGPVDDYNLLCDILKTLCKAAKEQGLAYPGPVRKFLAKDIMAYNDSFADDAFANGRVPGWETWLAQRKELGILKAMEGLKISEDVVMSD